MFVKLYAGLPSGGPSCRRAPVPPSVPSEAGQVPSFNHLKVFLCLQHLGYPLLTLDRVRPFFPRSGWSFATFSNCLGLSRRRHSIQAGPGSVCRIPLTRGAFFQPFRATTYAAAASCAASAALLWWFCSAPLWPTRSSTSPARVPFLRRIADKFLSARHRDVASSARLFPRRLNRLFAWRHIAAEAVAAMR